MKITILTIFPEMCEAVLGCSILGRARQAGLISARAVDIRAYSTQKHKNTDDYPFGGGQGMLMTAQPIADAMKDVCGPDFHGQRIFLGPKGDRFDQRMAEELAAQQELVLLCGHYEGVDQRALDHYIDREISVGDYILTGGELAALIVTDAVARLIPGVLGSAFSAADESFSSAGLLEYPQYTRPREFEGEEVPPVLLSGDHKAIAEWRRRAALLETAKRRPDLLKGAALTPKERQFLHENGYMSETEEHH